MAKWLLRGGRVVDPANGRDGVFDVLIDGDRIARVGRDLEKLGGLHATDETMFIDLYASDDVTVCRV